MKINMPQIMGILNLTPDSFSDGGLYPDNDAAFKQAIKMSRDGADVIDIGGESTRPGALTVSSYEELARIMPVIKRLKLETGVKISVDTSKPEVMEEVLAAGVDMINDVTALGNASSVAAVKKYNVPVCIMHMQGKPRTMQQQPEYGDVVVEVRDFLYKRAGFLESEGIDNIIIDPGFGFGKTLEHNIQLLQNLSDFTGKYRLLAGISRKSMLGAITGEAEANNRLGSSISAALIALSKGADIIRVHDVKETVDAIKVWRTIN